MHFFRLGLKRRAAGHAFAKGVALWGFLWALLLAPALGLAQTPPPPSFPSASVCANFEDDQIEPGSTPTFPGLWVNPEYYGSGWHIDYQDHDDSMSFSWFTFDKAGRPVWFQSTAQGLNSDGTMYAVLHSKRATNDGSGWTIQDAPASDAYLTIRVVDNDPSLLAIKWRWSEFGTGWHQECINDVTRVGPFFVGQSQLSAIDPNGGGVTQSAITPNAALTGLYREPALNGWGVAWTVLQVPQLGGQPAKYSEAAHIGAFDDNGNPVWLETEVITPTVGTPPAHLNEAQAPYDAPYELHYITRKPAYRVDPNANAPGKCTKAQAADCLDRKVVGQFDRVPQTAGWLDVSIRLWGSPTTSFDRPDGFGFVPMEKVTAQTQLLVDRAACVIPRDATQCYITVDWGVAEALSGPFAITAHVSTVGQNGYDLLTLGTTREGHAILTLESQQSAVVYLKAAGELLEYTPTLRSVMGEAPPILTWNLPDACDTESNCTVLPVGVPFDLQISASAGENGIAGVDFATGNQSTQGSSLCVGNPACTQPLPGGANRYGLQWQSSVVGDHYFWARAQSNSEEGVWGNWTRRKVRLGVPPTVQLQVRDRNGVAINAPFNRADPLTLRAVAQDSAEHEITRVEFFAKAGTEEPMLIGQEARSASHPVYEFKPWFAPSAGPWQLTAVAYDDQGTGGLPGTSAPVNVTAEDAEVALDVEIRDREGVTSSDFEASSAWDPYFHLTSATQLNKHRFSQISARVLSNNELQTELYYCLTPQQCECAQSPGGICDQVAPLPPLTWSPATAGSYSIVLRGVLEGGGTMESIPKALNVSARALREVRLTTVPRLSNETDDVVTPDSSVAAVVDPTNPLEAVKLRRNLVPSFMTDRDEIECVYLMRESEYSTSATCAAMRASPIGHGCEGSQCTNFSLSYLLSKDLCPETGTCPTSHSIIAVAKTVEDGVKKSTPVVLTVAGAAFESVNAPATMLTGQQRSVTMTLRNTGGTVWKDPDYRLKPVGQNNWGYPAEIRIPEGTEVQPDGTLQLSIPITAPQTPGNVAFAWHMARKNGTKRFGPTYSAEIAVLEPEDPNPLAAVGEPDIAPDVATPDHIETLGATGGGGAVSGGAATYEIPIVVPPGRRGMQPTVSLGYNSRNGNGVAGMGWSLGGSSSIHRCPRTVAQDGFVRAVQLDRDDALCLDGQRLVNDPESPVCSNIPEPASCYGLAGSVYRTEIDSFQRITQHGADLGSAGVYFEITTRDGMSLVYGMPSGSIPIGDEPAVKPFPVSGDGDQVLSWLLSYRRDTIGNGMEYRYDAQGDGETLLDEIVYTTFNEVSPAAAHIRKLKFFYESRPDVSTSYLAGYRSRQTQRLTQIETSIGGQLIRRYTLGYETSEASGRSLLDNIEECATDSSGILKCRAATSFAWHDSAIDFELKADPNINQSLGGLHEYLGSFNSSVRLYAAADYDGNGARDILWHGPVDGDETGEGSYEYATRLLMLSPDRERAGVVDVTGLMAGTVIDPKTKVDYRGRADFDLDGKPELLGIDDGELTLSFWGAGELAPGQETSFADVYSERWTTGIEVADLRNVHYVGDVDGEGVPEIVVASGPDCAGPRNILVYRWVVPVQKPTPIEDPNGVMVYEHQFAVVAQHTLGSTCTNVGGQLLWSGQQLERIADFNGDGLVDFWITDNRLDLDGVNGRDRTIALAERTQGGGYAIVPPVSMSDLLVSGETSLIERNRDLQVFWLDVNGDGLDDWLYPVGEWVSSHVEGRWALRMNVGGKWGAAKTFDTGEGLDCGPDDQACADVYTPWRAAKFRVMDTDSDGRMELLVPTKFAGRLCTFQWESDDVFGCSNAPGSGPIEMQRAPVKQCGGAYPSDDLDFAGDSLAQGEACHAVYHCPELMEGPDAGKFEVGAGFEGRVQSRNVCGEIDQDPLLTLGAKKFRPLYGSGGGVSDYSSYYMTSLQFTDGTLGLTLEAKPTTLVVGNSSLEAGEDLYGDGLGDLLTKVSCYSEVGQAVAGRRPCAVPLTWGLDNGSGKYVIHGYFEETETVLPNDIPLATAAVLVNRNLGAAATPGLTPDAPDMMWMVTDGLGRETAWIYDPLGSSAGRTDDLDLYKLTDDRVVSDAHINFTSSMHVVSEMSVSDGVEAGSLRKYRYGYEDALYDTDGRGFQGFRTVTEEDVAARTRTKTEFHQVFPLTGKPKLVVVSGLSTTDTERKLSEETITWSCSTASRAEEAGCASGVLLHPYVAQSVTKTYDAGAVVRDVASTQISEKWDVAAAPQGSNACITSAFPETGASSVDAYGNVSDRTTLLWDVGPDAAIKMFCERTVSEYSADTRDIDQWWINKLENSTTTRTIEYLSAHNPGDAAINKDAKTQRRDYVWTSQRLLFTETMEAGDEVNEVSNTFGYTTEGLPKTVESRFKIVDAASSGSGGVRPPVISRLTTTLYDDKEGYFPVSTENAAGHIQLMNVRPRDGQMQSATDANGTTTTHEYDAFGTLIRTSYGQKNGMTLAHPLMLGVDAPDGDCPVAESAWMSVQRQRGAPEKKTCFDLLGRPVRVISDVLGGQKAKQDTRYNPRGLVIKTTEPYIGTESGATVFTKYPDDDNDEYPDTDNEDAYDVLGRPFVKRTVKPDGELLTEYGYFGRKTDIEVRDASKTTTPYTRSCTADAPLLDSNKHLMLSRVQDSLGRFVKTVDANNCTTLFWHDALGNVAQIQDAKSNKTKATYNLAGFRTSVSDPNQGNWTFQYTPVGELRKQTDARQAADPNAPTTRWTYDDLGRVIERITDRGEVDGTGAIYTTRDTFEWDPSNAIGQLGLQWREYLVPGTSTVQYTERQESYGYDVFARRVLATILQAESPTAVASLSMEWNYDLANGRLLSQQWNEEEGLWFLYDAQGHHVETRDGRSADKVYWTATQADAWGRISQAQLGAQIDVEREALPQTGQVASIAYRRNGVDLQRFDYGYDLYGNLVHQSLDVPAAALAQEIFAYDTLHRLRSSQRSGSTSDLVTYTYERDGNIKRKLDYGSGAYVYGTATRKQGLAGPNAVRSVPFASGGSRTMSYDWNGNLISATGGSLPAFSAAYDAGNLPVRTQLGDTTLRFGYGPDGKRGRQWGTALGEPTPQRLYMEGYERTPTDSKYYVGDYALITRTNTGRRVEYLATDRLGSIAGIFRPNSQGEAGLVEARGFDPFGKPRQGDWQDDPNDVLPFDPATPRGFTAHEHLDGVKLIHMNGRAFDYGLGRFLSVDPVVQFPLNSQGLNPYSYILNNPLSGTDPTGYCASIERSGAEVTCEFTPAGSRVSRTATGTIDDDGNVKFDGPYGVGNRLLSGSTLVSVKFEISGIVKTNQVDRTSSAVSTVDRVLTASSRSDSSTHYTPVDTVAQEFTKDEFGLMWDQGFSQEDRELLDWAAKSSGRVEPFYGFEENFLGGRALSAVAGLGKWAMRIVSSTDGGVAIVGGSLDDLSRAAGATDRNGLTRAGRSLQKHSSRPGSIWNQSGINVNVPGVANARAQDLVDDVLTMPGSRVVPNPRGGVDVVAPDGRTIRYNRDGSFQGLRE